MLLDDLLQSASAALEDYWAEIVAAVIGVFAISFRNAILRHARLLWDSIARIRRVQNAIASDAPWLVKPPRPPEKLQPSNIPILTIANLKGGVGKTTLAANLAGYFAAEGVSRKAGNNSFRVLLIDLDFQGSLSSMLLDVDDRIPARGSLSGASKLVSGRMSSDAIANAWPTKDSDKIQAIPAYYDLQRIEMRSFMEWVIEEHEGDLRYSLRDKLVADPVQQRFDLIIIDAPPRLTTAAIQAFCASTHILIPTKLDRLSGDAVGTFVNELEALRSLWPTLRIIGSAGMMVAEEPAPNSLKNAELAGVEAVNVAVRTVYESRAMFGPQKFMLPVETFIAEDARIAECAGQSVAFLNSSRSAQYERPRRMIRQLGKLLNEKLHEGN
jgi:cellulose biosynthesis protein BcsQ